MKILDPKSGLIQVCSGAFIFPRIIALLAVRNGTISTKELGYFFIAVSSADWNEGEHRFGIIRHELKNLAKIWNIPYTTLHQNFVLLCNKGFLFRQRGCFLVKDFEKFQPPLKQHRKSVSDEELEKIFGKSLLLSEESNLKSGISDFHQVTVQQTNNVSNKVNNNTDQYAIIQPLLRTSSDYQRIYIEGNYQGLTPDDMEWLDSHISANGSYIP